MDAGRGGIRERFDYEIADPGQFDPRTPAVFHFADRRRDREQALFVQDQVRMGAWTVNAGVRVNHHAAAPAASTTRSTAAFLTIRP